MRLYCDFVDRWAAEVNKLGNVRVANNSGVLLPLDFQFENVNL